VTVTTSAAGAGLSATTYDDPMGASNFAFNLDTSRVNAQRAHAFEKP